MFSSARKLQEFFPVPFKEIQYINETGIDALAIMVGTAHGKYAKVPVLAIDRIAEIHAATKAHLVLHGGSGVPDDQIQAAVKAGIRKINYYSYMSKAGYMAAKATIESCKTSYLHDVEYAAMQAMKEDVKTAISVFSDIK